MSATQPQSAATLLNILEAFPLYQPNSAGSYNDRALLTIQTINQVFPFLSAFSCAITERRVQWENVTGFPKTAEDAAAAKALKALLDENGSDKARSHDYHNLYGPLLRDRESIRSVFEVGLGTNNTDVVSTMGPAGRPGASLRAFRDFLPNARIFGADIDKRILFEEERIKTFFVDQTDPASFEPLFSSLPQDIDLIIDDGLHSPNANIQVLGFGLKKVRAGGWVVIEDIMSTAHSFWETVAAIMPARYECHLLAATGGLMFAVKRLY